VGGGKGGDQGEQAARHTYRTQSRARVSQALTHVRPASRWDALVIPGRLPSRPKVGAGWGSPSRPDLCRGCRVTGIPTAIERLVTRTDGSLPWCCLPHVPSQVCYDGPRERCAQLVHAIVSQQGGKPDDREHGTIRP
jgi:hypothetical protein